MNRLEGYYWCRIDYKWDIFYFRENWYDGLQNSYKETDFEEIDEFRITRDQKNVMSSLPLTKQKLWEMAKLITDRQRKAKDLSTDKVDWNMLEGEWFDWLEEELFGND